MADPAGKNDSIFPVWRRSLSQLGSDNRKKVEQGHTFWPFGGN